MPTVLRVDGYRFFFFSDEHKPKYIYIEKADRYVRVELTTLKVTDSYNISQKEINRILKLVKSHKDKLIGAWDEYFE